jgi:isocitrate dehydrogenase kinase/phosphatase
VIRDKFPAVKNVRREEVMAKYDMVFRHDRAGRLVDAQEFKRIRLPKARFETDMLQELLTECSENVQVEGEDLIVNHVYIERQMTPLNLFVRSATPEQAEFAVIDYGQCIRALAYTNIFAGDLLLKNFGVTRHGRVVFYDYDELAVLTDCRFREVPKARYDEEEMAGEPWFFVGENDVFPEEFLPFLGLDDAAREAFLSRHRDLLTVGFWAGMQAQHESGEMPEIYPYPQEKRFPARFAGR